MGKKDTSSERPVIPEYGPTPRYRTHLGKRMFSRGRYFSALLKQKLSGREYPLIAIIVVNNRCNWDCVYCFGDYYYRREIDYTTDEIKYLIEELHRLGVRYVNLHGGEALMRPDIGELCDFAKHKGMYVSLVTNGSLLARKLDEIRSVDNLTISLDGNRKGNDENRGKGTFDQTLAAIDLALAEGFPLRVQATFTKATLGDVGYLARLAQQKGFHLQFSILFKALKRAKHLQMTPSEVKQALEEIEKYRSMGYPIFTSDRALRAAHEWPFDYNDVFHADADQLPQSYKKFQVPCYYSRTKFTIEADGNVYPCFLTADGSFQPKNWRFVGLKKALEHVRDTNTCRACPALTQNDHNLLLGLDVNQVGYVLWDQLKESLRIKNRLIHAEQEV